MSDELQVQQGQSSAPYALTGGVLGGGAGWAAAHYLTKPKYGSYDDIIKEARDSADFSSKVEKAEGEEKRFLEEAKKLATKRAEEEAEYDKQLEAYKKEHPSATKIETDEYKALKAAQTKAEEDLEAKKKALIDEQFNVIKNRASKSSLSGTFDPAELPTLINEATDKRQRDFNAKLDVYANRKQALLTKLDEAVDNNNKELQKQIKKDIEALETQIKTELNTEVSSWVKNPTSKANKKAIQATVERAQEIISIKVDEKIYANVADTELAQLEGKLLGKLKTNGGETFSALVEKNKGNLEDLAKALDRKISFNQKQENILKTVKYNYEKMLEKAGGSEADAERVVRELKVLFGIYSKTETTTTASELPKDFKTFVDGLNQKEKAAVERMLKDGEFTIEALNKAIERQAKETAALLEAKTVDIPHFRERIKAKGGVTYVDGVLLDAKGKKVNPRTGAAFEYGAIRDKAGNIVATREIPTITVPRATVEDVKKAFETGEVTALTDEEIRKQAQEAVKESAYQKETNAVNQAKKAAEEAYARLANGETLTAEQQEASFLKDKCGGAESKAKYVDGKVEEAANTFKKDFKSWIERKWGFAEHANMKIAGVAAASALVIGGIASALAPKNKG